MMVYSPSYQIGNTVRSALERHFISDFLLDHAYTRESIRSLPEDARKEILRGASQYASLKLAEIESCSKFISKIHSPD